MKNLTSLLLIIPLFSILTVQTVRAQTESEWQYHFYVYANQYGVDAGRNYALGRLNQMTTNAILQEAAWSLIEKAFGFSPCLASRQAICDEEFEAKMLEVTALSTAAGVACALGAAGNPWTFAFCMGAVAFQHAARLAAASRVHRACYAKARLDCAPPPTPTPTPCAIFGVIEEDGVEDGKAEELQDITPYLVDCDPMFDPCNVCAPATPIMVDVNHNGFDLTNLDDGVMFNLTGFGLERLGWTSANSDDAFLALDLNGNGMVDSGAELFGNFTPQPEPAAGAERNGFAALSVFDYNADGKIDSHDSIYSQLLLWQDTNHNGVSEPDELHSVDRLGLKALFLDYRRSRRVDRHGNEFRYRAKVTDFRDRQLGRWAYDVFLVSGRPSTTNGR